MGGFRSERINIAAGFIGPVHGIELGLTHMSTRLLDFLFKGGNLHMVSAHVCGGFKSSILSLLTILRLRDAQDVGIDSAVELSLQDTEKKPRCSPTYNHQSVWTRSRDKQL